MDVVFLSPAYPPEMAQFTRGLAEVGARVHGVGDAPLAALPQAVRRHLSSYLHVPAILDADDVVERVVAWLDGARPDRIEGLWEVVVALAARLRVRLGVPGMSPEVVAGFRDKVEMKRRVAAHGVRVPRAIRARTVSAIRAFAKDEGYPLILKPVDGAGSADTHRVDDPTDLDRVLHAVAALPEVSVEAFVEGDEYTYETLTIGGKPAYESVSRYLPNTLDARRNEWISPVIVALRDLDDPALSEGVAMGRGGARGAVDGHGLHPHGVVPRRGSRRGSGRGDLRRGRRPAPPGANMVDLMNYASDVDLFREWARAVVHGQIALDGAARPYNAAIVFKRAVGEGRIRSVEGLDAFVAKHRPHIARVDLLARRCAPPQLAADLPVGRQPGRAPPRSRGHPRDGAGGGGDHPAVRGVTG